MGKHVAALTLPLAGRGFNVSSAGARRRNRGRSNDVNPDVDKSGSGQHAKDAYDWSGH